MQHCRDLESCRPFLETSAAAVMSDPPIRRV